MIKEKKNKGFTLIEILVVMAISAIILMVVLSSFFDLVKVQALDKDFLSVASMVDMAKSQSINAKADSEYGVYFSTSSATLFKGADYVLGGIDNQVYNLNGRVNISAINLEQGNTDQIVFSKITGYASASGTVAISLKDESAIAKVITIHKTGTVEYK